MYNNINMKSNVPQYFFSYFGLRKLFKTDFMLHACNLLIPIVILIMRADLGSEVVCPVLDWWMKGVRNK